MYICSMSANAISVHTFMQDFACIPIIDVRSPLEYEHAHIPMAYSIPIFSNAERAIIGTAYKQQSREHAIKLGLAFWGKRLNAIIEEVEHLLSTLNTHKVIVHCARGGMRSSAVCWLLQFYGIEVYQLEGGYKAYRHWVLQQFEQVYPFILLSGYTGSAKTELLHHLHQLGSNTIDLEGIAKHKGSSFGGILQPPQPTQEMFENQLATVLFSNTSQANTIFIEDESKRIGHVNIPNAIYNQMKNAPTVELQIPFEERLQFIIKQYGALPINDLIDAVYRIEKKLGGVQTQQVIKFLSENNITLAFEILLTYYDKLYAKNMQLQKEKNDITIKVNILDIENIAQQILKQIHG